MMQNDSLDAVEQRLRQLGLPENYIGKHISRWRQLRHRTLRRRRLIQVRTRWGWRSKVVES
jgi:hypothetical protein